MNNGYSVGFRLFDISHTRTGRKHNRFDEYFKKIWSIIFVRSKVFFCSIFLPYPVYIFYSSIDWFLWIMYGLIEKCWERHLSSSKGIKIRTPFYIHLVISSSGNYGEITQPCYSVNIEFYEQSSAKIQYKINEIKKEKQQFTTTFK